MGGGLAFVALGLRAVEPLLGLSVMVPGRGPSFGISPANENPGMTLPNMDKRGRFFKTLQTLSAFDPFRGARATVGSTLVDLPQLPGYKAPWSLASRVLHGKHGLRGLEPNDARDSTRFK